VVVLSATEAPVGWATGGSLGDAVAYFGGVSDQFQAASRRLPVGKVGACFAAMVKRRRKAVQHLFDTTDTIKALGAEIANLL
jgi:hypothetical protein